LSANTASGANDPLMALKDAWTLLRLHRLNIASGTNDPLRVLKEHGSIAGETSDL
jgi:hypothetical protein